MDLRTKRNKRNKSIDIDFACNDTKKSLNAKNNSIKWVNFDKNFFYKSLKIRIDIKSL